MSTNFNLIKLKGRVIKKEESFYLERQIEDMIHRSKILDATSRSPLQSKRFEQFTDRSVEVEGYYMAKIFYVRKIKGA